MSIILRFSVLFSLILPTIVCTAGTPGSSRAPSTTVPFARRALQGFDMRVWLSTKMTMGIQAWDVYSGDAIPEYPHLGLEYPLGNPVEHLYGAGPWIGAKINGIPHVDEGYNGNDARNEFIPSINHNLHEHFWHTAVGASANALTPDSIGYSGYYFNHHILVDRKDVDNDGDGTINEDPLDGLDNDGDWNALADDLGKDGLADSIEVSCDGTPFDPLMNPDPAQDNYDPAAIDHCRGVDGNGNSYHKNDKDYYTERNGIPDHGEPHVDEDYGAVSDNDLYCSATDTFKTPIINGHVPMGIKVSQRTYAWRAPVASAIIPIDYEYTMTGRDTLRDIYIATFADMDLGPVSINDYVAHNYAAYDSSTRTAYIHNPVDRGSTPLGLTVLQTSRPVDSLKFIFQWFDYTTQIGPGSEDSLIYEWMSGNTESELIKPNQSPTALSDTRFLISFGPFPRLGLQDTLRTAMALVSGMSIDEMLNNARRAGRIFEHKGFVMPEAEISDSGNGIPLILRWSGGHSPFGDVAQYLVRYGVQSGIYTDSLWTTSMSLTLPHPPHGQKLYFIVQAIDNMGRRSAESDEIYNTVPRPDGLTVAGNQTSILATWDSLRSPILSGYYLYRRVDTDTVFTKIIELPATTVSYSDSAVWGNHLYWYQVTAVDADGFESSPTPPDSGHLIRPAIPAHFVVATGNDYCYLNWLPNNEQDFVGYNIYRRSLFDAGVVKLNTVPFSGHAYLDTSITIPPGPPQNYGAYWIEAVDRTDAVSAPAFCGIAQPVGTPNILALIDGCSVPVSELMRVDSLLARYNHQVRIYTESYSRPELLTNLNKYSSVLWLKNCDGLVLYPISSYPGAFKSYIMGGGNLLVMGRGLTARNYPYDYDVLSEIFGFDQLLKIDTIPDFAGANSTGTFPNVTVGQAVPVPPATGIGTVERFTNIPSERVVYVYRSSPVDLSKEGMPVGLRKVWFGESRVDLRAKAYYFSFPLLSLDSTDQVSLLAAVLNDFGEMSTGVLPQDILPTAFRLHDAYPNPFNPSTVMKVDVPAAGHATLTVYDILGREVARLLDRQLSPGRYIFQWNGMNGASGVYFVRLLVDGIRAGNGSVFTETKKLILTK